jgi:hypothetical protein
VTNRDPSPPATTDSLKQATSAAGGRPSSTPRVAGASGRRTPGGTTPHRTSMHKGRPPVSQRCDGQKCGNAARAGYLVCVSGKLASADLAASVLAAVHLAASRPRLKTGARRSEASVLTSVATLSRPGLRRGAFALGGALAPSARRT